MPTTSVQETKLDESTSLDGDTTAGHGESEKPEKPEKTVSRAEDSDVEAGNPTRYKHHFDLSRLLTFSSKNYGPASGTLDDALLLPEASAGWFSILTFQWMSDLLALGYARPLEATDVYKLQDDRSAEYIANKILASFRARQEKARLYNERLAKGEINPGLKGFWWSLTGKRAEKEKQWREKDGRKSASLTWSMNDAVKYWFWSSGALKVIGDTAQITSPLVVKAIINFATNSYSAHTSGDYQNIPSIGLGIGLTFVLLVMQMIASLCTNHFFYRSASTGVLLRGGLITAIYSRSLKLTSRARGTLTNGRLVNHISTDVSRIDFCCGFFHMAWTAPIQMVICLILLIINLGPSALAGFAFFVIATPIQTRVIKKLFGMRRKSMFWTDKRAKLLQELLGGMRVIKYFAWEVPFLKRVYEYRQKEMSYIRSLLILRSANNGVAFALPILASVLSFITYSLTGHSLNAANIFSSLTLFQLLRLPLMFLPMSFSTIADAQNAIGRLHEVFEAETLEETLEPDAELEYALEVKGAEFTWDAPPPAVAEVKKGKGPGSKKAAEAANAVAKANAEASAKADKEQEKIFKLKEIDMTIPRGQLVAIVGPVGTGKSSLLQGLIGEMRQTAGSVKFGGTVSYAGQNAWLQNATVRENICFGRPFIEEKYWDAVRRSCLEQDLDMWPHGDLTEVGEKGISLSGGQKQRVNICRAIYCDTEIQIFDDPLSALDAHVGKLVFNNVLNDSSSGKTRILVTHALHFLPQVDYIYTLLDGRIAERGTYAELVANNGPFSRFMAEFATKEAESEKENKGEEEVKKLEVEGAAKQQGPKKKAVAGAALMQAEERNTGAVSFRVYREYLKAGKGIFVIPFLIFSLVFNQGATVMSSYWLVYWEERKWHQSSGFYMGTYAMLGFAQAIGFFLMGSNFAMLTYFASQRLHKMALERVMYAPMSFFDTTPLGRIMNRFSKDIDTIDNTLGDSLRMFFGTFSSILGAIILISIVLPWFLIAIFFILSCYFLAALFYRASARELKRLDAILRSSLYTHFSESLSGLTTIRAYGEQERFRQVNVQRMDIENRAYWLTVANQRWLGIRLDFLGAMLTFVVSMLTVGTRFKISPAQTGLVLSYILSVQQSFGWMVRQSAEVENDLNSVERVLHYAQEVEQEAPHEVPAAKAKLPTPWPSTGRVEMKDVVLRYRPDLPPVLKRLTMTVAGGEKIGIVGRTGAGKSSIMTALFRIVELSGGSIVIDGVDISKIGLADLRSSLSIIPQDPLLFSGTLRSNLDPFSLHDDARLWDALKRSYLVEDGHRSDDDVGPEANGTSAPVARLSLDSPVEDEGSNLSVGQRSLVSLARALVKDTKVLILDEATASVDYETDRKIQETIAQEFHDRTILCIAHRLRTIISYDKICVLDAGEIAEFDTPEKLYSQSGGIFRGMCERSSISLEDILLARRLQQE